MTAVSSYKAEKGWILSKVTSLERDLSERQIRIQPAYIRVNFGSFFVIEVKHWWIWPATDSSDDGYMGGMWTSSWTWLGWMYCMWWWRLWWWLMAWWCAFSWGSCPRTLSVRRMLARGLIPFIESFHYSCFCPFRHQGMELTYLRIGVSGSW